MTAPRRILLAQTSFLGDVVLTTPLARVLADAFSAAEIWWLVRPDAAPLVTPLVGAERVIAFDKRGAERGLGGLVGLARRLRALELDVAIGVQRSLRTAVLLALARVRLRVGFSRTLGAPLYHRRVPRRGGHARDRLLGLATALGVKLPSVAPEPRLEVDRVALARVDGWLAAAGVGRGERLLVLAPGSAWATKRWPTQRFAEAASALVPAELDRVVIVGAAADAPLAVEIEAGLRAAGGIPGAIDLTGRTTTAELVAALARASLVLANDSAPAHVAAALGRPVVAVFGPTVPAQGFAPLGPHVKVVERALGCRPCSRHGSARCPIGTHECLVDLGAAPVVAAARSLGPDRAEMCRAEGAEG